MPPDDVLSTVRALIADSLAIDQSAITPQSRLIDDLGADSLDFVDLIFAIEKAFGVKLREADLNFLTRLDFSSPTVMRDGFLTRDTIDALAPLLPGLQHVADRDRVTPGELFSLLTVETLCLMIERRLSTPGPAA
jgi:acyl carrier protein